MSSYVWQKGFRDLMMGAVWWKAVQHGLGGSVRTGWKRAAGHPERCRMQDRVWKWAVQGGLRGNGQKPGTEQGRGGRWRHRAAALALMPSHGLQGGCTSYRKPSFPGGTCRAPELPDGRAERVQTQPDMDKLVQHGVASQQQCWDTRGEQARARLGQPMGPGPTETSCQCHGAAPAWFSPPIHVALAPPQHLQLHRTL